MRANPQQFVCARCPHLLREQELWAVNARALDLYHRLCGRTTADLGLAGWLLQAVTDGWTTADVVDLLARLELIRSVLDPAPAPRS